MQHTKALVIKFIMCLAVLSIVLGGIYGIPFVNIFTVGVALTILSYFLGDLFIMPRFENWGATIADFLLTIAAVWFLGNYLNIPLTNAAFITASIIAVGEYFFHKYVANHVLDRLYSRDVREVVHPQSFQTEFSTELNDSSPVNNDRIEDK